MTATDESTAFVAAICANPGCDTARLVFADWLEEHGDEPRARWIRFRVATPDLMTIKTPGGVRAFGGTVVNAHSGVCPNGEIYLCRGFIESVTCTAADWLKHADALHWHPEQRVTCPRCDGLDRWERNTRPDCPDCDGAGRVPRPCPPTAQPITRVTLATRPTVAELVTLARSHGYANPEGAVLRASAKEVLETCFEGVTFDVPDVTAGLL